ncbi:hypothetical protein TSOC_014235 [Tetrabaena socialis]|uniref:Protein kinase domain-containing protein n=1 Tax=Tetrabaena socialis TaxID=47790 RepID=A0A2J7ZI76_9CHLO|nr:hypothetical protein TSOC_014235 [Tetrabaena socialis]|eukprot:PNG99965.1 hypothetical protein TSOC_014235 [Tetrabaena socialis]
MPSSTDSSPLVMLARRVRVRPGEGGRCARPGEGDRCAAPVTSSASASGAGAIPKPPVVAAPGAESCWPVVMAPEADTGAVRTSGGARAPSSTDATPGWEVCDMSRRPEVAATDCCSCGGRAGAGAGGSPAAAPGPGGGSATAVSCWLEVRPARESARELSCARSAAPPLDEGELGPELRLTGEAGASMERAKGLPGELPLRPPSPSSRRSEAPPEGATASERSRARNAPAPAEPPPPSPAALPAPAASPPPAVLRWPKSRTLAGGRPGSGELGCEPRGEVGPSGWPPECSMPRCERARRELPDGRPSGGGGVGISPVPVSELAEECGPASSTNSPSSSAPGEEALQGTLASASLASSLLQPAAVQWYGGFGGGGGGSGSSALSTWSAPALAAAGMGMGMGVGMRPGFGGGGGGDAVEGLAPAATAPARAVDEATEAAAAGTAAAAAKGANVKILLYAGGAFSRCPSGVWEYCGGETRLISIPRADQYQDLAEAIVRAADLELDQGHTSRSHRDTAPGALLKYELPGCPDLLVDLRCDEDVANMWEALEEYCRADAKPTFKLKMMVQQASLVGPKPGSRPSHSGGSSSATGSARNGNNRGGAGRGGGGGGGDSSSPATASGGSFQMQRLRQERQQEQGQQGQQGQQQQGQQQQGQQQQGQQSSQSNGSPSPIGSTPAASPPEPPGLPPQPPPLAAAATAPPGGAVQQAATAAALAAAPGAAAAAARGAAAAADGDGDADADVPSYDAAAASEREAEQALLRSELGDLLRTDPRVGLSELESKLELIQPDDLQIIRFLGSGGYGEVYLCRWHSCDVAVKCLNPSLLLPEHAGGSTEVVTELLREAAMLGGLRHPNIVWVYGIVLPGGVREVKAKRER